MCGRYVQESDYITNYHQYLRDFFDSMKAESELLKSQYNIAPTSTQLVRCVDDRSTTIMPARWGLVPSWSKDGEGMQINARSETVHEKPAFKSAFHERRCLALATGYYEWHTEGKSKHPYFIHLTDHKPFFFLAIWQFWKTPESREPVATFATLTTQPKAELEFIHNRMPCIIPVDHETSVDCWLDCSSSNTDQQRELLKPFVGEMQATPVSSFVNNVRNQGPQCIVPIEA